jgi:O-antigen/teichoic acid export membrane protein
VSGPWDQVPLLANPTGRRVLDERGRARERLRRVALTSVASLIGRAVSVVTLLVSLPLTVGYLGTERFGLFATIASISALLGASDLGIGNGLVNAVAEADARGDRAAARTYVSSAVFGLGAIALFLGVVLAVVLPVVPWAALFNVSSSEAAREAGPALAAFVGVTLFALPFGVAQRVQAGYQEGYVPGVVSAFASVAALGAVIGGISLGLGLPLLVLALTSAPLVGGIVNTILLFWIRRPWLRPTFAAVDLPGLRYLISVGGMFLIVQLVGALAYQSDTIILARIIGPHAVTDYTIPLRLFGVVTLLIGFVLTPLWPAYRESIASGDPSWARTIFRRSLWLSGGTSAVASLAFLIAGKSILNAWVPTVGNPQRQLLLALALWTVVGSVGGAFAMFLNGLGAIRFQAACGVAMVFLNIPLSVVLTKEVGVAGVVWGSLLTQVVLVLVPSAFFVRRQLRQLPTVVRTQLAAVGEV